MGIFRTTKTYCEAYLAQRSGIPLKDLVETKIKILMHRAPRGQESYYLSVQHDGSTILTEIEQEDKGTSDELALREEMGDSYANAQQQEATHALENISRNEMHIRDSFESLRENREKHDELLRNTTDYHFAVGEARKNLHLFIAIALCDILAMFMPFADFFGIDPMKLGSEILRCPIMAIASAFIATGFFVVSLLTAEQALYSKHRTPWTVCLILIALIIGQIRTMQTTALQERDVNSLLLTLIYMIIGVGFPLVGTVFYRKWRDASRYVSQIDSTLARLVELEVRYIDRLRGATEDRISSNRQLDEINQGYVAHYQWALREKEKARADWGKHLRFVEAYVAELKIAYMFWEGWRSRDMAIPRRVKRLLQVTGVLLIVLVFSLAFYSVAHADTSFNLLAVCDRSSSASEFSCTAETIENAGRLWLSKVDDAGGGTFELYLIDKGFDTTTILFSARYPERFPGPVTANKKKWRNNFLQELSEKTNPLPNHKGSAIIEAIYRSSLRIPGDGETLVYIMSDMRELNETFNFENQVPSEREFRHWLEAKSIRPKFARSTGLYICGLHPYTPLETSKMTTENYERLLKLWHSVFEKWGIKTKIYEACSLNK